MVTRFGRNLKLVVAAEHRAAATRVWVDGLGAEQVATPDPTLTLFRLGDGFQVGVYFVSEGSLPEDLWERAPWLELAVADPDATGSALEQLGAPVVPYRDPQHRYHRLPGGPVVRLTQG